MRIRKPLLYPAELRGHGGAECGEGLRFLPIADPRARRVVHMLTRKDRSLSPAARQFAQILQDTIAQRATRHGLKMMFR